MKYILDTNICIGIINGKDPSLRDKIRSVQKNDIVICSVIKAELIYGAKKSQQRIKNEQRLTVFFSEIRSLSFDDGSADYYGTLRVLLEQSGTVIGANDLLIGAIAQQHQLTLVTRNHREFARIPSLNIEVW